jgi:hypothetical protein
MSRIVTATTTVRGTTPRENRRIFRPLWIDGPYAALAVDLSDATRFATLGAADAAIRKLRASDEWRGWDLIVADAVKNPSWT